MGQVLLDAVGGTVVGTKECEPLAFSDGTVQVVEEIGQLLVESDILLVGELVVGAIFMAGDVGTREADANHIGLVGTLSQAFALDGGLCHLLNNLVAVGLVLDVVDVELLVDFLVVGIHPPWQLVHIVGAADKALGLLVEPVGGIGAMACGKNGGAVLERYANDLRLPRSGGLQFVADGGHPQVAGRHLAFLGGGAHGLHGGVAAAVGHAVAFPEVVAGNAVDAGHRTGVERGVADGGHRGDVVNLAVLERVAFAEHAAETVVGVVVVEAVEIVPAHLVDGNAYHQFGADFAHGIGKRRE